VHLHIPDLPIWFWAGAILAGTGLLALLMHGLFYRLAHRMANKRSAIIMDSILKRSRKPVLIVLFILALLAAVSAVRIPAEWKSWAERILELALFTAFSWLAIALTRVADDFLAVRYPLDVRDNLMARQVHTRIRMLRRILIVLILTFAASVILMSFPMFRRLGTSILASAGIAGIVVGMAARPTLSNLIAGLQVALTEPIRIDDVVIVEGEWGWIEEIRMTFVVVRIWDLRRLILPLTYFIEKPFQNWTRVTADLLGTVFLYADYTVPVEAVRQELHRVLESTDMWDRKVWNLLVTNADGHTVEMRALMSAADSGTAFSLRCYVRERLIGFLQENYPQCLPRTRADIQDFGRNEP
jgi:small-conductance mechanosensitive channel